jgi:hypothetical protein
VFLGRLGAAESFLARLEAVHVTAYRMDWARRREGTRPDVVTLPALPSFLRFLHVIGHSVSAGRRGAGRPWPPGTPRADAAAQDIQAVLDSYDRESAIGSGDYAIVMSPARQALQGGEREDPPR